MANAVLPEPATSDRLATRAAQLNQSMTKQTNRMIFAVIAVTGQTLMVAKLIGTH